MLAALSQLNVFTVCKNMMIYKYQYISLFIASLMLMYKEKNHSIFSMLQIVSHAVEKYL